MVQRLLLKILHQVIISNTRCNDAHALIFPVLILIVGRLGSSPFHWYLTAEQVLIVLTGKNGKQNELPQVGGYVALILWLLLPAGYSRTGMRQPCSDIYKNGSL